MPGVSFRFKSGRFGDLPYNRISPFEGGLRGMTNIKPNIGTLLAMSQPGHLLITLNPINPCK